MKAMQALRRLLAIGCLVITGCESPAIDTATGLMVAGVRSPGVMVVFADVSKRGESRKYCPKGVLATDNECSTNEFTGVTGADKVCRWPGDNADTQRPKKIHWKSVAFDRRGKKPDFTISFSGSLNPCVGNTTGSGNNQICNPKPGAQLDFPTDPTKKLREFKYTVTGDDCTDQPLDPYIVFRR